MRQNYKEQYKAVWINTAISHKLDEYRATLFNDKGNSTTRKDIVELALSKYFNELDALKNES